MMGAQDYIMMGERDCRSIGLNYDGMTGVMLR
jgi:hypothetical protein